MARSSECTDEYAQNELNGPTLSETLIEGGRKAHPDDMA